MDIVLDVKQTEIPFFMMVIRNEYLNFFNFIVQKNIIQEYIVAANIFYWVPFIPFDLHLLSL